MIELIILERPENVVPIVPGPHVLVILASPEYDEAIILSMN